MPYVLTCSLCGRGTDVERFGVSVVASRSTKTIRVGAGAMELCSACWTKYCLPNSNLTSWDDLQRQKSKVIAGRGATNLPLPIPRARKRANA